MNGWILFFVCGLIDYIARKTKNKRADIVNWLGKDRLQKIYDIVEGPMADDQIWNFVEGFIDGRIPRKAFWELVKFNYPTHQIVFCTEEALKTLTFKGSDRL